MIANKQQLADIHGVSERTLTDWANAGMAVAASNNKAVTR